MIGRKNEEGGLPTTDGINAFVGRSTTFEGKIRFEGLFRIDGKYDGEILSGDTLLIGETGEVSGQINVNSLIVSGTVQGNVTAMRRIEIHPSGQIVGDIQTPVLVILEGALFAGNSHMERREIKAKERVSSLSTTGDEAEETGMARTE